MPSRTPELVFALALAAALCAPAAAAPSGPDRARAAIDAVKRDPGLYAGEGQADFKGADRGEAREKARDRALADLSKKIRIQLEVIVRDESGYQSQGGRFSADEAFRQIINSRTDQAVSGYQDRDFLDYPEKGMYTVVVSVSRQKVDEETRADLGLKKEKVLGFIKAGDSAQKGRGVASALRDYLSARELLERFFPGLPVAAPLGDRSVELGAHVDSRLEALLGAIVITPLKESVSYTAEGKPRGVVAVGADLKGEGGAPVANLPLAVRFSKGAGRLGRAELSTDEFGKAEIPLEWVDPSSSSASLEVALGAELAQRLPAQAARPSCAIALSRGRSISYAVRGLVDGAEAVPQGLEARLREVLREAGFDGVKLTAGAQAAQAELTRRARDQHADYLLVVDLSARSRREADLDMYSAQAQSSAALHELAGSGEVFSTAGPAAKGFGAGAADAAWDALGKVEKGLLRQVAEKLRGVR